MFRKLILFVTILLAPLTAMAESVTYKIVEYNASAGDFTLSAWGEKPKGSYAIFENDYGATTGNATTRYRATVRPHFGSKGGRDAPSRR